MKDSFAAENIGQNSIKYFTSEAERAPLMAQFSKGKILDAGGKPLSGQYIYVIDQEGRMIISRPAQNIRHSSLAGVNGSIYHSSTYASKTDWEWAEARKEAVEKSSSRIEEIKANYLKGLTFHYVKTMKEVLDIALLTEKVTDFIEIK
jgi:hypothetical protein